MEAIVGLLAKLFGKVEKKVNIVMCGLDNAGKTSILCFLRKGEFSESIATIGVNHDNLKLGSLAMSVMDLGGQAVFRQFWTSYIKQADILIFVVDSTDFERMSTAQDVFNNTLNYCEPNIPILILATKQDLPNACPLSYIIQAFNLTKMYGRTIHLQRTSAKAGFGIYESFHWIHEQVVKRKTRSITKNISQVALPKPS